jgi:uncharacterized membrane protein YqjE
VADHEPAEEEAQRPRGLFESLRALLATVSELLHTRLELVGTEVEEQFARLASLLIWSIVALFLAFTAIVLVAVAIIVAFWESHRVLVAVGLAGLFAVLAGSALSVLLAQVRARPRLFQATLDELAKDRQHLNQP